MQASSQYVRDYESNQYFRYIFMPNFSYFNKITYGIPSTSSLKGPIPSLKKLR